MVMKNCWLHKYFILETQLFRSIQLVFITQSDVFGESNGYFLLIKRCLDYYSIYFTHFINSWILFTIQFTFWLLILNHKMQRQWMENNQPDVTQIINAQKLDKIFWFCFQYVIHKQTGSSILVKLKVWMFVGNSIVLPISPLKKGDK